jgi:hypothetical protein
MVVRVDEAGHDDAPARVDVRGPAGVEVRTDGQDLLAFDQHVGLGEIAHVRIHRHHRAAADDVAAVPPAVVFGRVVAVGVGRTRREQVGAGRGNARRRRRLQEVAPRIGMTLRLAVVAQLAHGCPSWSSSHSITSVRNLKP